MVILDRLLKLYLILSLAVIVGGARFGIHVFLEHNPSAIYCEYELPDSETNYVQRSGERCRIRFGVLAQQFGALFAIYVLVLQGPVYLFFLIRHGVRRRSRAGA